MIKMEHDAKWLKLVPHSFFICQAVMSFNIKKASPKDSLANSVSAQFIFTLNRQIIKAYKASPDEEHADSG